MNKNKKSEILRNIIDQLCTISTLLFIIVYTVVPLILPWILELLGIKSLSSEFNFIITITVLGVTMLIILPCIVVINSKWNGEKLIKELQELTDKLKDSKTLVDHIVSSSIIKKAKLITNQSEFFKILDKTRRDVSDNAVIRLMNFAKTIHEQDEEESKKKYYQKEMEFYLKNKNVKLFRIVSIHTKEKFNECLKLARAAKEKELENFNLAYLQTEKFKDGNLSKIIGVDIIGDTVILMNPKSARIDTSVYYEPLLLQSEKISEIYSDYHKAIWDEINKYHNKWFNNELSDVEKREYKEGHIGHILFTGGVIADEKVWMNINNNLPENKRFSIKELADLVIKQLEVKVTQG